MTSELETEARKMLLVGADLMQREGKAEGWFYKRNDFEVRTYQEGTEVCLIGSLSAQLEDTTCVWEDEEPAPVMAAMALVAIALNIAYDEVAEWSDGHSEAEVIALMREVGSG